MSRIESCLVGLKHAFLSQMSKQLPTRNVLHEHVQASGILSQSIKVNNKRMVNRTENFVLIVDVVYLLRFNEF